MKSKLAIGSILVGSLLVPAAAFPAEGNQDRASPKAFVADATITAKIKADFAMDREVSALHIRVDTDDHGIVQLSGRARTQKEADRAVQIAQGVNGVTVVQNRIRISDYRSGRSTPMGTPEYLDFMASGGA